MSARPGEAPQYASSLLSPQQAADSFLKRLPATCRLLVAFSGGSDSTGLLAVLSAARKAFPGLSLHSATVDHALRSGSAAEARSAGMLSERLAVPHAILDWAGEKPATGIQAAARAARYRLLAAEAERVGAQFIVTAHTADDQRETLAMRRARDPAAEAGMDEAVLVERRIWVARPFLRVGRDAIRSCLRDHGLPWSDDPSNDNPAFERVRVRQGSAMDGEVPRLPSPTNSVAAGQAVRNCMEVLPGATVSLDLRELDTTRGPHRLLVATLVAILGGRQHAPASDAMSRLAQELATGGDFRLSLGRVVLDRRKHRLYLGREARGLDDTTIPPGECLIWDGRYEIANSGGSAVRIAAGRPFVEAVPLHALPPGWQAALPGGVARRAEVTVPRLVEGDARSVSIRHVLAPFEHFLPYHKLALAQALATAFHLEHFPTPALADRPI